MDAKELLSQARESISVKRVFGEPYERNGVTLIPVAKVGGGGGGGGGTSESSNGEEPAGEGWGGGFGLGGKPVGAYVIRGEDVRFEPAIDRGAIIVRAITLVGLLALVLLRRR